jgi:DNA polymerase III gamma/tau subunit
MPNNLVITQRPKKLHDVIGQTVITKEIRKRIV